jgi:DNA-binding response OmpR family regulator
MSHMATNTTLLCIHREPAPFSLLRQNGYEVLTANNGHEGLRLFMTRHVDAIVLEYHLGFLDGGVVATEIKKTRPQIPILMVIDNLEVPDGALKSVDMVVAKFDGEPFLLSAVRSVLETKPVVPAKTRKTTRVATRHPGSVDPKAAGSDPSIGDVNAAFSTDEWQSILNGTVRFRSDA